LIKDIIMPSRTVPPQWRRAFLRALSVTANITLAAHRAGIDKTTAYYARKRSPLFARLWTQALADARAAIAGGRVPKGAADRTRRTRSIRPLSIRPLSLRPLSIRSSKSGHICVMETGEGRWNEEVEADFFAHLAATANVKGAARAIGMSTTALYKRRKLWPAFDAQWEETVQLAVNRLDMQLIAAASNMLDPPEVPVSDIEPVTVDQAIRIVQLHKDKVNRHGASKRHDWRLKRRDPEEVRASIIRKLDAIERHERS
jgi:hypothetical protein